MATRTDRISVKEAEVLGLIANGKGTGKALAEATGRSREGCHQTAASLVRKGWAYREAGPVNYLVTDSGRAVLRLIARFPDLPQGGNLTAGGGAR